MKVETIYGQHCFGLFYGDIIGIVIPHVGIILILMAKYSLNVPKCVETDVLIFRTCNNEKINIDHYWQELDYYWAESQDSIGRLLCL